MIIKQCQFPGKDDQGTYLHLLYPGEQNDHLEKTASIGPPQLEHVRKIIRQTERRNGHVYVLVSALGAGEYWGSNSNADTFPEEALIHTPPGWNEMSLERQRSVGPGWEWGYPTFYNAHAFSHHCNKDVKRAFGSVHYVMWDNHMKRVLLILDIDRAAAQRMGAQSVVDRIENGEFADVSMGTKVLLDFCSICTDWSRVLPLLGKPKLLLKEHKKRPIRGVSATRQGYCQHLKFELNKIYPDGRKVQMINMHPRFFDLSFVFIGADKTSKVMAKLAGERLCPIRDNSPMCKSGCYNCAIPSSHVYEVWSRGEQLGDPTEKIAERAQRSGAVAVSTINPQGKERKQGTKWHGITARVKKEAATFPGFERELKDEEKFAAAFGIDKQSALNLAKKAEIIKQIRSNFSKALPGMESEEPEFPKELIKALAQDLPDALASAGSMGIVAKPKEFQRMILISRGKPQLADDLDEKGICFNPGASPSSDSMIGQIIPGLLEALAPMLGGRSALAPAIHKRVVKITVIKPTDRSNSVPEDLADNPVLSKIGADYSAYRQQLLYKLAALTGQLIHEHPWVLTDLYGELPERSFSGGLVKAGGDVMESLIGMFPIDYLNKVHLDRPVSAYVDDHCDLDGLVVAGELASCGRVA